MAKRLEKLAAKIDTIPHEAAKTAAMTIVNELAYVTPVDTSRALSNWQVGLSISPWSARKPFFIGSHGSTQLLSAKATVEDAKDRLRSKVPGQVIYISNLVPYIRELNAGSSRQHPGLFVEASVMLAREQLRKITGSIK